VVSPEDENQLPITRIGEPVREREARAVRLSNGATTTAKVSSSWNIGVMALTRICFPDSSVSVGMVGLKGADGTPARSIRAATPCAANAIRASVTVCPSGEDTKGVT
jgi:hypothetical protein